MYIVDQQSADPNEKVTLALVYLAEGKPTEAQSVLKSLEDDPIVSERSVERLQQLVDAACLELANNMTSANGSHPSTLTMLRFAHPWSPASPDLHPGSGHWMNDSTVTPSLVPLVGLSKGARGGTASSMADSSSDSLSARRGGGGGFNGGGLSTVDDDDEIASQGELLPKRK